ncbi:MAG: flagellar biosynthetic protein FliO [Acidobacteriota bacterium]|nr:flagellar biosynthetic protein FliO [Acidobacteriota bacterium]
MKRLFPLVFVMLAGVSGYLPAFQEAPPTPQEQEGETDAEDPALQPVPTLDQDDAVPKEFDSTSVFFNTIGKLMIVIGLVILLGYLSKKFLPSRFGGVSQEGHLKLIQSLPLGTRRFVSLIEADGKRFLVGVTENQINLLKALDDEDVFTRALSEVEEPKRVRDMLEEEA